MNTIMKRSFLYALAVIVVAIGMASCDGIGGRADVKFRKMNLNGVNTLALASRGQKAGNNAPARLRADGGDELVEDGIAYSVSEDGTLVEITYAIDCSGGGDAKNLIKANLRLSMQYVYTIGDDWLWLYGCNYVYPDLDELPEPAKSKIKEAIAEHSDYHDNFLVRRRDGALFEWDGRDGRPFYGNVKWDADQTDIYGIAESIGGEIYANSDYHMPRVGQRIVYRLKDEGNQLVVTSMHSENLLTEVIMPDKRGALGSPDVINGKDNVFQVCFTDPNQGLASAQYIVDNSMASKVAVIYNNSDAYSTGIYQTFSSKAAELGLEIVSTTTFTDDTANDFSVQLGDAKDAGAELIFLPIYYQPASLILQQAANMGYNPTFFGVDGMDGILTMDGFDTSLAEGVILLTPFSADAQDDLTKNFVTKYNADYGETPNQFAADGYDCPYAIYKALQFYAEKNGDLDVTGMSSEEICNILIATFTDPAFSYDGVTGNAMVWAATGEVNKAPKAVVIKNGVYVGL